MKKPTEKVVTITRKIELWITDENKEKRNEAWSFLRELDNEVYKAYNLVISNQFFNDQFTDRIRKTDSELTEKDQEIEKKLLKLKQEIKACKEKEEKEKLLAKRTKLFQNQNLLNKDARAKAEGMYLTSEMNTTYQLLGDKFPNVPSAIRTCINVYATASYRDDAFDVKLGKRSIRSYRKGIPIPFVKSSMRFFINEKNDVMMNWLGGICFNLHFGRDKSNNREIVNRALDETYKICDSKIQIDGKKIFLLLVLQIPQVKVKLDPNLAVGVNLGIVVPAYCAISKGLNRLALGDINDFFRVRRQMQERRKQLQKHLNMAKGGRGRDEKLKALDKVSICERDFAKTYNHRLSFRIVDFALKNGAGVIKMELLAGYGENGKDNIILRNWSYFELHSMVEYKAKKYGIEVQYTDPHRISHTCAVCGEYHEDNLETRNNFVCKNGKCSQYGVTVFSDYNAALNNAKSLKLVSKKEDCQYYKNQLTNQPA